MSAAVSFWNKSGSEIRADAERQKMVFIERRWMDRIFNIFNIISEKTMVVKLFYVFEDLKHSYKDALQKSAQKYWLQTFMQTRCYT